MELQGAGTGQGQSAAGQGAARFFFCDVFDASPKDDLASMEHPLFSLSTRPDRKIRRYEHNGVEIVVTPSVRGRATLHDKDILIYCISQLMAALNAGREVSRELRLTAHDLLISTRRDTGGDSYVRLREAFERLAGTRITTNLATGGVEVTTGFGLIESWQIVRRGRGGRMISVSVVLAEWLYRAVLTKSVLTLSRDYFALRKPLERRVYELARKHCGRQSEWRIGLALLQKKAGSDSPLRVFRAAMRRMIAADALPDYALSEEPGDIIRVTRRLLVEAAAAPPVAQAPLLPAPLSAAAIEAARRLAPGEDVHALEAEWRAELARKGGAGERSAPHVEALWLAWLRVRREMR